MMELLIKLLDNFENDLSEMSFAERYDQLAQQLFAIRLISIRKMATEKKKLTAEESELIKVIQDSFDEMDKMYMKMKKAKRIAEEPPNERFGAGLTKQIKEMKSSIPSIERTIPK
jgi:protein subunit release factor A